MATNLYFFYSFSKRVMLSLDWRKQPSSFLTGASVPSETCANFEHLLPITAKQNPGI